jgi:hypothetical protein
MQDAQPPTDTGTQSDEGSTLDAPPQDAVPDQEPAGPCDGPCFGWLNTEPASGDLGPYAYGYTYATSFTPSVDIELFHVRVAYADRVVLYDSSESLVWNKEVNIPYSSSAMGAWQEVDVEPPIVLAAGENYRIGIEFNGSYVGLSDPPSHQFQHGTVDAISYYTLGSGYPYTQEGYISDGYWSFIDIRYAPR